MHRVHHRVVGQHAGGDSVARIERAFTASVLPKTMVEGSTKQSTMPVLPIG